MVLPRWYIRRVEEVFFSLVDPWQTYVPFPSTTPRPSDSCLVAGSGKSVLWFVISTVVVRMDSNFLLVLGLLKTSKQNTKPDRRSSLISIATSAMKISRTAVTSCFPSSRSYVLSPIFAAMHSPAYIWHMTRAHENLATRL